VRELGKAGVLETLRTVAADPISHFAQSHAQGATQRPADASLAQGPAAAGPAVAASLGNTPVTSLAPDCYPRLTRMAPGIGGFNIPASPRQKKIEDKIENTIENKIENTIEDKIENKIENKIELEPQVQHQRLLIFDVAAEAKPSAFARFGAIPLVLFLAALLGLGTLVALISLDGARQGLVNPAAKLASLMTFQNAQAPARLIVANQRGSADEPLPLGISVEHASGGETVTIRGLPGGSELSLGSFSASAGWTVVVGALDQTFVAAPKGFIGNIDMTISLRSATGQLLDERTLRLDWTARNKEQPPSHGESHGEQGVSGGRPSGADTGGTVAQGPPRIPAAQPERRRPRRRFLRR